MITRQQYLDDTNHSDHQAARAAYRAYYAQFVNDRVKEVVRRYIGKKRLSESSDPHLNDIPLRIWDLAIPKLPHTVAVKLLECDDYLTLAGGVSILKEAARQLIEAGL